MRCLALRIFLLCDKGRERRGLERLKRGITRGVTRGVTRARERGFNERFSVVRLFLLLPFNSSLFALSQRIII